MYGYVSKRLCTGMCSCRPGNPRFIRRRLLLFPIKVYIRTYIYVYTYIHLHHRIYTRSLDGHIYGYVCKRMYTGMSRVLADASRGGASGTHPALTESSGYSPLYISSGSLPVVQVIACLHTRIYTGMPCVLADAPHAWDPHLRHPTLPEP